MWFFLAIVLVLLVLNAGFRRVMLWLMGAAAGVALLLFLIGGMFFGGFA